MPTQQRFLPALVGLLCAALVAMSIVAWQFRQRAQHLHRQIARLQLPQPTAPAEAPPEQPPEDASDRWDDAGDEPDTPPDAAAHAEFEELQRQLAEKDRMIAHLREAVRDAHAEPEPARQPRRGPADFMNNLKESDPERYAEIQERMRTFRQRMEEGLAEQSSFFVDLDTSSMTEAQVVNHERLLELMAKTWETAALMQNNPQSDEAREARETVQQNMRELSALMESERSAVLQDIAADVGYDETGQQEFAEYVNHVVDMTSMSGLFRRIRPEGRGGSGRTRPPRE